MKVFKVLLRSGEKLTVKGYELEFDQRNDRNDKGEPTYYLKDKEGYSSKRIAAFLESQILAIYQEVEDES